jgi:hypothetical protein
VIVGYFGQIKTPADLPASGYIDADWDGPGRPATGVQVEHGWALVYQPTGELWVYAGDLFEAQPWLNVGMIQGPRGEPGPPGPPGPTLDLDQWHDMRPLMNGASYPGGGELVPQYRFNADRTMVVVVGTVNPPNPALNTDFFQFPPAYRPPGIVGWAASPNLTANPPNSPRFYVSPTNGGIQIAGGWTGPCRISGQFAANNPDIAPIMVAEDWLPLPNTTERRRRR